MGMNPPVMASPDGDGDTGCGGRDILLPVGFLAVSTGVWDHVFRLANA